MDFILKLWQVIRGVKAHADVAVLHARWVRNVAKKDLYRLKAIAAKAAYEKFSHPASRYALAGVAVAVRDGQVRAAFTGAGAHATRLSKLEAEGTGSACQGLVDSSTLLGDAFASKEYRAHLIDVMQPRSLVRDAAKQVMRQLAPAAA